MPEDYAQQVLSTYVKLKEENKLSQNLLNPTPGNLRDECLLRREEMIEGAEVLRYFCESRNISKLDIDKFKAVVYYLKGKTAKPNIRVVELVAWLIGEERKPDDAFSPSITINWKKLLLSVILSIAAAVCLFLIYKLVFRKSCMQWMTDHYEYVDCNIETSNLVVAADIKKIKNQRKVMREDTITYNSIGKLWYLKTDNNYEFFTMEGKHPIYTTRKLRIVTKLIVDNNRIRLKVDSSRVSISK